MRGMETPSFTDAPWPSVLGRREWLPCAAGPGALGVVGVEGAGDCERDVVVGGGPRAQADLDGSGGGSFEFDAVEDLLILQRAKVSGFAAFKGRKRCEWVRKWVSTGEDPTQGGGHAARYVGRVSKDNTGA